MVSDCAGDSGDRLLSPVPLNGAGHWWGENNPPARRPVQRPLISGERGGSKENPHLKSGLAARTSYRVFSPFAGKAKHRFAMRAFAETMGPDFTYPAEKQRKLRLDGVPEFQEYLIFPLSFVNVA